MLEIHKRREIRNRKGSRVEEQRNSRHGYSGNLREDKGGGRQESEGRHVGKRVCGEVI